LVFGVSCFSTNTNIQQDNFYKKYSLMSKLDVLTIAIVIVCLAALGYLVYKIVDLVNPPEEATTSIQDSYADDTTDDTYTDWDNEADTAGDDADLDDDQVDSYANSDQATTPNAGNSSYSDEEMDNESTGSAEADNLRKEEEVAPSESTGTSTNTSTTSTAPASNTVRASNSSGRYMVIAGTYRQRSNADQQVARLRKMGYDKAEVSLFDSGTYALALVDRFGSYGDAKRLVNELKGKGVDALIDEK
jgi:cell division protein FtsN